MNPTDIIRHAKELSTVERRAVWYLQSRFVTDGSFDKVAGEILSANAGTAVPVRRWNPYSKAEVGSKPLSQGQILDALNTYLTCGPDAAGQFYHRVFCEFAANPPEAKRQFHLTNIGSLVWETLDWCREERRPCFIEGREGRGKTSAARAWHEAHRGESRYISLPGLRTQRDFFEAVAAAYGVSFSFAKAPNEIRFKIKDVIIRSGLIPIFDEAHHALPERHRSGRPPLIDWIDCDLCNAGVPVVLVSTPQFGPMLSEFEDRSKWNAGQFRRRFSGRWTCLPEKTNDADLAALAEQALPKVGTKGIQLATAYAGTFGRDVSGLFDLVRDAERRARKAGHSEVTFKDLRDAYEIDRVPSENAMANAFKRPLYAPPGGDTENTLPDDSAAPAAQLQRGRTPVAEEVTNRLRGTPDADLVTVGHI